MKNDVGAIGVLGDKDAIQESEISRQNLSELIKSSSFKDIDTNTLFCIMKIPIYLNKNLPKSWITHWIFSKVWKSFCKDDESNLIDIASTWISQRDGFVEAHKLSLFKSNRCLHLFKKDSTII